MLCGATGFLDNNRRCVVQNRWVSIGGLEVKLHLNVRAELDPRFVVRARVQSQIFQVNGNVKQPVFSCKFSLRSSGEEICFPDLWYRNQVPHSGALIHLRKRKDLPPLPPHSQRNQLPLGVQVVSMQPAVQHPRLPPYFKPPLQVHHSHPSQIHSQPQNQTSSQSHFQIQPQASQYQNQYPQVRPPPLNQPTVAVQPQLPHPPASSVTGHHSYQQPQPAHQMHSGVLDQTPINLRPTSGSLHSVKLHGQVPHQPAVTRPPPSHDSFPPQPPSTFLLPQSQVSGPPPAHLSFSDHAQHSNHLPQHGTVLQLV